MAGRRVLPLDDIYLDGTPAAGRVFQTDTNHKLIPVKTEGGSESIPDDYVITRDTGLWVAKSGGGGGGGSNQAFGATGPRTLPPSTGWSWFQQRGSTVTTSSRDSSIHLLVPAGNNGASTLTTARMRAAPSTPYTIIANLECILYSANYVHHGLCFGNAGSEIRMLYYGYVDGAINLYVVPTSGGQAGGATFGPFSIRSLLKFLAIRDDGTNKKYYVGAEEENMLEIYSEARTTQFTPTEVGFMACPRQNTWPVDVTLWSWKEQSAAPA